MNNGKISVQQMAILVLLVVIGDSILIAPSLVAHFAKEDAWISGLLGVVLGTLLAGLIYFLSRLHPHATLVQFNRTLLGKWMGGIMSSLFLLYFLLNAAAMTREIGDFITTQIMPETPLRAIHLLLVILLMWALYSGIETIARTAELLFPWFVIFFVVLLICLAPKIEIDRLLPIMGHGFMPILQGSIYVIVFPYAELTVFLMLFPLVTRNKHTNRDFILATALGGIAITAVILICILVLGPYITAHQTYPTYALAKKISIGGFLERVEAFLAIIWIISIFFKTILYAYAFLTGFSQLFHLRNERILLMPSAFLFFGLAYAISPNIIYYDYFLTNYWPLWDFTYALVIPLVLMIVHLFRRKKRAHSV
ncbi:endospore germination permease [Cohnella sp. WQ 127256]|uniref:GerAB/ArcD/ProY family transporter n=1 Tax=Cohnella sp. WQ 127256 TaxID=2938790 RepID=UPI002119B731|nr:endospore germination permease [Cohnella sp. WQ 127256]